jgi:hypothetical protein
MAREGEGDGEGGEDGTASGIEIPGGSKVSPIVPVLQIRRLTTSKCGADSCVLRHSYVLFQIARRRIRRLPRLPICIKIKPTHPERAILMTDNPDPDKLKGPGGLTLRQIHEQVQKSVERDRKEQATRSTLAPPKSRWQRWVRYVWGRSGRR